MDAMTTECVWKWGEGVGGGGGGDTIVMNKARALANCCQIIFILHINYLFVFNSVCLLPPPPPPRSLGWYKI